MENSFMGSVGTWLAQNVGWVLLVLAWGALVTYLKAVTTPYSHLVEPILYGLGAMVMVAALVWLWKTNVALSAVNPTTPTNIEGRIRDWMNEYGVASRRISGETDEVFFQYDISSTGPAGTTVSVARAKRRPQHLVMQSRLIFVGDTRPIIETLSRGARIELGMTIQKDVTSVGPTAFSLELPFDATQPPGFMSVILAVPITTDFSGFSFMSSLDAMGNAVTVAQNSFWLNLKRLAGAAFPADAMPQVVPERR